MCIAFLKESFDSHWFDEWIIWCSLLVKESLDFIDFLISENKNFNIIFTKADKLKKINIEEHCKDYFKQLNKSGIDSTFFICSSTKNIGISEIRKHIKKSIV